MLSALYPSRALPRAAAPAARPAVEPSTAYLTVLMLLTLSYHLWLAAITTHLGIGGDRLVMVAELAILAACVPLLVKRLPPGVCLAIALVLANGFALSLLRMDFDPKPMRDVLIPLVFLWVGMNASGEAAAERVLRRAIWLVMAFALFEFFFLDLFTRVFDIFAYYLSRGAADPDMGLYRDDRLVASGIRPEDIGRTILPVLGAHRVSSVFIEPVSLGNFATICAAWGLAKPRWRDSILFLVVAAMMVALADSRFGLVTITLLALLRLLLVRGAEPVGIAFPILGVVALIAIGVAMEDVRYSDTFLGRLSLSGRNLMEMDARELFGAARDIPNYYDMGYAYVLANFGLPACLLLWAGFWLLPMSSATARRFRVAAALYISLILCVSGTSVFAMKTSALLWFLLGSLVARDRADNKGEKMDTEAR